jgi:hypothetical protein
MGAMLWTGLFCSLLWKRRRRNGWHGALIGVLTGFVVFILASAIGGYVRASAV